MSQVNRNKLAKDLTIITLTCYSCGEQFPKVIRKRDLDFYLDDPADLCGACERDLFQDGPDALIEEFGYPEDPYRGCPDIPDDDGLLDIALANLANPCKNCDKYPDSCMACEHIPF